MGAGTHGAHFAESVRISKGVEFAKISLWATMISHTRYEDSFASNTLVTMAANRGLIKHPAHIVTSPPFPRSASPRHLIQAPDPTAARFCEGSQKERR